MPINNCIYWETSVCCTQLIISLRMKHKVGKYVRYVNNVNVNLVLFAKTLIGLQEHHLMFKGPIQLNYIVLAFMHFYAIMVFQFV